MEKWRKNDENLKISAAKTGCESRSKVHRTKNVTECIVYAGFGKRESSKW